jgi:hypothetical protein
MGFGSPLTVAGAAPASLSLTDFPLSLQAHAQRNHDSEIVRHAIAIVNMI